MKSNIEKRKLGTVSRRIITLSHHVSYHLAKRFPNAIPVIFVVGYPKSGTVWACQMISDYLDLPFADLSYFPTGFPSVMHGHYRIWPDGPRSIYVVRDGRDAMTSMYFYLARGLPSGDHPVVPKRLRQYFPGIANRDHVRENLPRFIEAQMRNPEGCRTHWGDHVRSYYESGRTDVPMLKYEDMLADCPKALAAAIATLTGQDPDMEGVEATVRKYTFQKQSGRSRGAENRSSFLRKAQAGDWRNHFTLEAAEVFDRWCGKELVAMGYEQDRTWVNSVK